MNRRVIKDREINIEVFEPNIYIFEYTSIKKKKNNNNMKKTRSRNHIRVFSS